MKESSFPYEKVGTKDSEKIGWSAPFTKEKVDICKYICKETI